MAPDLFSTGYSGNVASMFRYRFLGKKEGDLKNPESVETDLFRVTGRAQLCLNVFHDVDAAAKAFTDPPLRMPPKIAEILVQGARNRKVVVVRFQQVHVRHGDRYAGWGIVSRRRKMMQRMERR